MGRSYRCDFCDVILKDDVNMRKNHNNGLKHKMLRNAYYEQFKGAKQILEEQAGKTLCMRLAKNQECKFGSFCRFSHYTPNQILELQCAVKEDYHMEYSKVPINIMPKVDIHPIKENNENFKIGKIENHTTYKWDYPVELNSFTDLPPSLQLCNLEISDNDNDMKWC